jgi:DNA (cytosine-5)-methyltransferase 1
MNVLDLFSGIGGFSLGLERAGMKTVAFCEVDKKCQQVLKKHWPGVPIFDDVSTLKGEDIEETVDVICGGFPCQDISLAGKGAGLEGERSGLWTEFHRLIKEIKPKYAIIENVSALRSRGLDQVLREISEIGYDAEWHCITAASVGAPHRRDRVWIVAYPRDSKRRDSITGSLGRDGERKLEERIRTSETTETTGSSKTSETMAHSQSKLSDGNNTYSESSKPSTQELGSSSSERDVFYANDNGSHGSKDSESNCSRDDGDKTRQNESFKLEGSSNLGQNFQGSREEIANVPNANNIGTQIPTKGKQSSQQMLRGSSETWRIEYGQAWAVEPDVGRVAHGVSGRVDRLKQLGNAVVPQIPELIGRAICQAG